MYKCGIIGCGWIGIKAPDSHLRAYLDYPHTGVIAFCDVDKDKIPILLPNGEMPTPYDNYKVMVKYEQLDIVSVCTPVETHYQIVCDIAPYVKAIYCEKPIATTLEEADKMIETCHRHNVILQVNHQRRFMPVKARFARDIIDTGTHMFDRLRQLFGEFNGSTGNIFYFGKQPVEIEYIKSDEHIFEIDCVRSKERMILQGVKHLVECLNKGKQSISSGEEARQSLVMVLSFKEIYENNR